MITDNLLPVSAWCKHTIRIFCGLIVLCTLSCVNLKAVRQYASASSSSLEAFAGPGTGFEQYCRERCIFDAVKSFTILREPECDCALYKEADKVTNAIYRAIHGYLEGLSKLSADDLTAYKLDNLENVLSAGKFGGIEIEESHIKAYGKISTILLRAGTDAYRKKKIAQYIADANDPLQLLLTKLAFIIGTNLNGLLNFKKEQIYVRYTDMKLRNTLSDYEKGEAAAAYYRELEAINNEQAVLKTYAKSLNVIAKGHQKLYDLRGKLTSDELRELALETGSQLQDLFTEFKKLYK